MYVIFCSFCNNKTRDRCECDYYLITGEVTNPGDKDRTLR